MNIQASDDKSVETVRKEIVEKKLLELLSREVPPRIRKLVPDAKKKTIKVRFASEAKPADKEAGRYFRVHVNPMFGWQNESLSSRNSTACCSSPPSTIRKACWWRRDCSRRIGRRKKPSGGCKN